MMFSVFKEIEAGGPELQDRAGFASTENLAVIVVADGVGGISGGAEAAEFAVQRLTTLSRDAHLGKIGIAALLMAVDREMALCGTLGETTCVMIALTNSGVAGASVGDSGAAVFSDSGLDMLTAQQNRKPYLGSGQAMPVAFSRESLEGTLLVATDGLWKYAKPERLMPILLESDLEGAAKELINLVRFPSGALPDDVSVVLARCL